MKIPFRRTVLAAILSCFAFSGVAFAQSELLFGQNHFYTVVFRGNGEAIAYAKLVITNPDEKPMTDFSFEVPKVSPSEMVIYQINLPRECIYYTAGDPARPCVQYREPDYGGQYYYYGYGGRTEYQKVQYTKSGNLYRFTLPTPVAPYKSTAILVAYAAKGYISESFGLYRFNFETLKVPSRIQTIRVAVDVDSDLFLKGKRSSVNYNTPSFEVGALAAPQSVSSGKLDQVIGNIGSYGPLVKEAKNLAPNESFVVKGEYATSWFRLYLNSILLALLIIAAIIAGIYYLAKFMKRRGGQGESAPRISQGSSGIVNATNALASLGSALAVIILTYLLKFLGESGLSRFLNYDPVFGLIGFLAIILLYVIVIFGPAIVIAIKHGWASFVVILIGELIWFVVFLVIYLILFQSGLTSNIFFRGIPTTVTEPLKY